MGTVNDEGFKKSYKVGKVGESAYLEVLEAYKASGKIASYLDLSENALAQSFDCDFAVFTQLNGGKEYTEADAVRFLLMKGNHPEFCKFIEVKSGRKILETENVFLEIIMHGKRGCFAVTGADKWIYYGLDEKGIPVRAWSIDIEKTRTAIADESLSVEIYPASNNKSYSFKVKIDDIVRIGAAKELML